MKHYPHTVVTKVAIAGVFACCVACSKQEATNADSTSVLPTSAPKNQPTALVDSWRGRWLGPEGTFLEIEGGDGVYQLTIANLDGPRQFNGKAQEDRIVFQRDGNTASIHATNGVGTGMKWLREKENCLVIEQSEGFCRD